MQRTDTERLPAYSEDLPTSAEQNTDSNDANASPASNSTNAQPQNPIPQPAQTVSQSVTDALPRNFQQQPPPSQFPAPYPAPYPRQLPPQPYSQLPRKPPTTVPREQDSCCACCGTCCAPEPPSYVQRNDPRVYSYSQSTAYPPTGMVYPPNNNVVYVQGGAGRPGYGGYGYGGYGSSTNDAMLTGMLIGAAASSHHHHYGYENYGPGFSGMGSGFGGGEVWTNPEPPGAFGDQDGVWSNPEAPSGFGGGDDDGLWSNPDPPNMDFAGAGRRLESRLQLDSERLDILGQQRQQQQEKYDHVSNDIQRHNSSVEQQIQSKLHDAFEFARLILTQTPGNIFPFSISCWTVIIQLFQRGQLLVSTVPYKAADLKKMYCATLIYPQVPVQLYEASFRHMAFLFDSSRVAITSVCISAFGVSPTPTSC